MNEQKTSNNRRISRAGIVIGVGLGGLIDSFLLHMIWQWHHMLSNIIPADSLENMHRLMMFDGIFDAFCFLIILTGVFLFRNAIANDFAVPSFMAFAGQLIFGWGLFNTVEGVIDHHILRIHYVRQTPDYAVYNWTFLAVAGLGLLVLGWLLMRRNNNRREISE